ncbi:MAG: hypothetical protein M3R04_07785 [bacterium]|nr:hypothetical protein [bacterium]
MKGIICVAVAAAFTLLYSSASAEETVRPPRPPAQYKSGGAFKGGSAKAYTVIDGIRFGTQEGGGAMRMVLDFDEWDGTPSGIRRPATAHPGYSVELLPYPYRLVIRMNQTMFDSHAKVMSSPALPFSVVAEDNGMVKEMQVFLSGPSEFKVIEVDDPAKLSIDVRSLGSATATTVFTVQLTDPHSPEEAFALVEQGSFPDGFKPRVLVLGSLVIVEGVYTDMREAVKMDASLRSMGYACVINERPGNELPQP